MKIQKGLLILLFVLLFIPICVEIYRPIRDGYIGLGEWVGSFFAYRFSVMASASADDTNDKKRVFISEDFDITYTPDTQTKQFLFFNCDGSISDSDIDTAFLIFSNVKIGENVTGTFYSIFSELRLGTINTGIAVKTLFSKVFTPPWESAGNPGFINQIFDRFDVFSRVYFEDGQYVYNDTISSMLLKLLKELIIVGLFSLFFAIRKSFFEQGALAVKHEYLRILKSGLSVYAVILCGIAVFFMTVFGVVFSAVLALATVAAVLIGCAALYLFIGGLIAQKTGIQRHIYIEMVIGLIMVELVSTIPYVKITLNIVIIPIAALGIVYTALMNMYINKNFYESPYAIG